MYKQSWLVQRVSFVLSLGQNAADLKILYWDVERQEWIEMNALLVADEELESGLRLQTKTDRTGYYALVIVQR